MSNGNAATGAERADDSAGVQDDFVHAGRDRDGPHVRQAGDLDERTGRAINRLLVKLAELIVTIRSLPTIMLSNIGRRFPLASVSSLLPTSCGSGTTMVTEALREALALPTYMGSNWDGLEEVLAYRIQGAPGPTLRVWYDPHRLRLPPRRSGTS